MEKFRENLKFFPRIKKLLGKSLRFLGTFGKILKKFAGQKNIENFE